MNKEAYLNQLSRGLKKLPESERKDALQYYNEYFQDSQGSEEEAIQALGSPNRVANSILAESNVNKIDEIQSPTKKGASAIGTILLLVFAAPIGLPLAIAFAAVIIALAISVLAVIFSLAIAGLVGAISGIILVVSALSIFSTHAPTAVLSIGIGLTMLGISALLCLSLFHLGKRLVSGLVVSVKKRVGRGVENETKN